MSIVYVRAVGGEGAGPTLAQKIGPLGVVRLYEPFWD